MQIEVTYIRDPNTALWSFTISEGGRKRHHTEAVYTDLKAAKRTVGEITKVIKTGKLNNAKIIKTIIK